MARLTLAIVFLPFAVVLATPCSQETGSAQKCTQDNAADASTLLQLSSSFESTLTPSQESDVAAAIKKNFAQLGRKEKKQLWWSLTEELDSDGELNYSGETPWRHTLNLFVQQVGTNMETAHTMNQRCAETGDGHFLKANFGKVCATSLVVDKYASTADVKLDLNLQPGQAPESIKQAFGTIDLLVSNEVFEHLLRPSLAMSNLNALLKSGGNLVFTTPFIVPDHRSPKTDYFRYTVMAIDQLLQCAGFDVKELRGLGNKLESLAYLAGVSSDMMDSKVMNLASGCDAKVTDDCAGRVYSGVAAVAVKKEEKTFEQIHDCFG